MLIGVVSLWLILVLFDYSWDDDSNCKGLEVCVSGDVHK